MYSSRSPFSRGQVFSEHWEGFKKEYPKYGEGQYEEQVKKIWTQQYSDQKVSQNELDAEGHRRHPITYSWKVGPPFHGRPQDYYQDEELPSR